jgi:riboflavin biosynthesis pyrimidine reductase
VQRLLDTTIKNGQPGEVKREEIYRHLNFPRGVDAPYPRPYTALNMVSTIDGKVVIGGPGTTRLIGTPTDHYLMARIEAQADAVLLGAGLAREDDPSYPEITDERVERRKQLGLRPRPLWAVVSSRGEFARLPRVLEGGGADAALFVSEQIVPERKAELEKTCRVFIAGRDGVDPVLMGKILRDELDVYRMICLGGPGLNATMLAAGAADELFLTLAPKLQGGSGMPTMVEGRGYPPSALPTMELLSLYADGGELYLRYKLPPAANLQMAPLADERRAEPRLTVP